MLDPRIERMLQETEKQAALPPWAARDLREAVESSPYLASAMSQAIDSGSLKHVTVSKRPHEGGHYSHDSRTLNISSDVFLFPKQSDRVDVLTGVMGHETGHALMARSNQITTYKLSHDIDQALKVGTQYGDATVDITPLAKDYVHASRQNEALAELVGMNAVASRVKTLDGGVSRAELLKRLDPTTECVTNGRLEPGIRLDNDGMQRTGGRIDSPAVDAVGTCQFDKGASSLGVMGTSNYQAYYASYVVSAGADIWKTRTDASTHGVPKIGLNLGELGVSAKELQAAGVRLGGTGKAFGFVDTSGDQQRYVEVRQLRPNPASQPERAPETISRPGQVLADNPAHDDHQTYARIHAWVKGTGNWNEQEGKNVSAALYKQQAEDPLVRQVDKVGGGLGQDGAQNVFAVYAPHGEKGPFFHVAVDGREASQQPAQQNLEQAQTIQQTQVRQQQLDMTQQQANPTQMSPSLSL